MNQREGLPAALERTTAEVAAARSAGRYLEAVALVRQCHETLHDVGDAELRPFRLRLLPLRVEWALTFALADLTLDALRAYERAHSEAVLLGEEETAAMLAGYAGLICALSGDLRNAAEWIAESVRLTPEGGPPHQGVRLAQAVLALDRWDDEGAEALLDTGHYPGSATTWAIHSYVESMLAIAQGSPQAGLARLRAAARAHFPRTWTDGINEWMVATAAAYLLLAGGETEEARAEVDRHSTSTDELGSELASAALAWARLRDGNPYRAISIAAPFTGGARGYPRTTVDLMLVAAVANLDLGNEEAAGRHFRSAFELARPVQLFIAFRRATPEERTRLVALSGVPLAQLPPGFLTVGATTRPSQLLPRLTTRERVILRHLVEGRSTDEIAAAEHVTKNTVKTQTSTLFRKLDVRNRAGAVDAAAQNPGLLG